MARDMELFKMSLESHKNWQLDYFNIIKQKLIDKSNWHKDKKNDLETWDMLLSESDKMKFIFDKSTAKINYGNCTKLNKPVSFIPNTCQLDTQECFKHRRDKDE